MRKSALRAFALVVALVTGLALAVPAGAQEPGTNQSYIVSPQEVLTVPLAAQEPEEVTPARVEGATRFETAANIATLTYEASDAAVLVTGQDYPDALAGSFAAGRVDGPLLLTARDSVPAPTMAALEALGVEIVVVVGGTGAVSEQAEAQLTAAGYGVQRVQGVNRFQTASAVAMRFGAEGGVGTLEGDRTAILASGERFPDALSAGPLAAAANLPLFLTPRGTTEVSVNTSLQQLEIERIIVVGGTAAVSSDVVQHYLDQGYEVERFAGGNRTATAVTVAQNAIERFDGFSAEGILLAASIHGAVIGAPVLLTATPTALSPETAGWLADVCPQVGFVRALGGTGAVSAEVLGEAAAAAGTCLDGGDAFGEAQFTLTQGTYDDGPVDPVELALFPCESVLVDESGVVAFDDTDGDGLADRVGETDTGTAWISQISGVEQARGQDRDRGFEPEGYTFSVGSDAPDCTVPVLWAPSADPNVPDTDLPVDEAGEPTVRFGIGIVAFVEDG